MSLQILFHLKFAPLPSLPIPTWQLSRAWMWPWDGDGIVSHWGGTLAPAFDQWSLDWCWHSAFTGKWLESATPAVPWTVLLKIDSSWASGTELGQQDPLDLHHALRPPCGLGLADVYFKPHDPHRTARGCQLRGDKLSSTSAVLFRWHGSCLSVGYPTGHPLAQDLYLSTSGNRMTAGFHGSPTERLLWEVRMLSRHYLIGTVSALQKISVTLSIFTR